MKKFLVGFLLVIPMCGFAQKGIQEIGASIGRSFMGRASGNDYVEYISLMYQHNLTDKLRIEPNFRHTNMGGTIGGLEYIRINDVGGDLHFFMNDLPLGETIHLTPYIVGGVAYGFYSATDDNKHRKYGDLFSVKIGAGINYRITYRFLLQAELHLDYYGKPYSRLFLGPELNLVHIF